MTNTIPNSSGSPQLHEVTQVPRHLRDALRRRGFFILRDGVFYVTARGRWRRVAVPPVWLTWWSRPGRDNPALLGVRVLRADGATTDHTIPAAVLASFRRQATALRRLGVRLER